MLKLPLSHALPLYLKDFPHYDRLPQRISDFLHDRYGYLKCIDVGANIGDTIAAFYKDDADTFLAIEPNPKFNRYLLENWHSNPNVAVLAVICSSQNTSGVFRIIEGNGTASIVEAGSGRALEKQSLDAIASAHPFFATSAPPNVLKVDTDGHDFEVIAGAVEVISRYQPAVLFECDVFGNDQYVEDCLRTLSLLRSRGYNHVLLYDNFGCLMGKHSLADLTSFEDLLFYQLTSRFHYFDVLALKDEDLTPFYASELNYFCGVTPDASLQRVAEVIRDRRTLVGEIQ